jgi:RHS repeat-associated protein
VWGDTSCPNCGTDNYKLTKIIDSGNNEWKFKYDIMGNVTEMIYPDGSKITQDYDLSGRLTTFTNKRQQQITYEYDSQGRLWEKITPEGIIRFSYDNRDRMIEIEANDYHYQYRYGVAGVNFQGSDFTIVEEKDLGTGQWTQSVNNKHGLPAVFYDSLGWKKMYYYNFSQGGGTPIGFTPYLVSYYKRWNSSQYRTVYSYDSGNRLTKKRTNFAMENHFQYNNNGLLQRIRYIDYYSSNGFPESNLYLNRDFSGVISSITGERDMMVTYNPDLEIANVQHISPTPFQENYTNDPRGNRLTSLNNAYSYNHLNQMLESANHFYQHDAAGNLVYEKSKISGEAFKYFYNYENRLTRVEHYQTETLPPDMISTYTYDFYGRRLQKNVNGVITNFLWEGNNLANELDFNYQPIRRYIYGADMDDVEAHVEMSEVTGSVFDPSRKGWYTYVKDQVGTVYKVYSDYHKQIVDTRTYDTFGNLISQNGSSKCNLGFQGKYFDLESGLYYFYNRYYNPANGRFINEDPIGLDGGLNMYDFVKNDPLNYIDPFGLLKCKAAGSKVYRISVDVYSYKINKLKPRIKPVTNLVLFNWKVLANIHAQLECRLICTDDCGKTTIKKVKTSGIPQKSRIFYLQGPGNPLGRLGGLIRLITTKGKNIDDYMTECFEEQILKQLKDFKTNVADEICQSIFGN